jgi:PAS domain S-box-containing protein
MLRIQRYTPTAIDLFNLIPTDLGRPLTDLRHKLLYDRFTDDAKRVLDELATEEKEVQTSDDRWYLARMQPYRTIENSIDGVVLTFVDITRSKHAELSLGASEERFRMLMENVQDYAIFIMDTDGIINTWNAGVERVLGFNEEEFIGQSGRVIFIPEDQEGGAFEQEMSTAALAGRALDERWSMRKDGEIFWASGLLTALRKDDGELTGYAKILRDMTEHKRADDELQLAHAELEKRVEERTRDLVELNESLQKEIAERRELEKAREQSEMARKELLARLVAAQEEERHRISRELHDQMGQQLAALLMGINSLPHADADEDAPEARDQIGKLHSILSDLMERVHNLAWDLRPAALDNLGLQAALRQYVREWSARYKLRADFVSRGFNKENRLPAYIETALYRIVQESLNNVQRHAEAANASVLLERLEDSVVAIIEDDGKGFDIEAQRSAGDGSTAPNRLGVIGMQERMEGISGTLTIESAPGQGTTVYARAPLERRKRAREKSPNGEDSLDGNGDT